MNKQYVKIIPTLSKIATSLDEKRFYKQANEVDQMADELTSNATVERALDNTAQNLPDHLAGAFSQRNPGAGATGSVFKTPQTVESLKAATWRKSNDPNIKAPAIGFEADIPGTVALVQLSTLAPDTPVKVEVVHGGNVTVQVGKSVVPDSSLEDVDYTTLLVGPHDVGEVVWTFYPGSSVAPSIMAPSEETEAARTVADAIALGFDLGKIDWNA